LYKARVKVRAVDETSACIRLRLSCFPESPGKMSIYGALNLMNAPYYICDSDAFFDIGGVEKAKLT
ncbi:hypothetical protein VV11_006440, partial [Trichodesmium erythraeum 21-75]|nr:hypothetical protein [Trichodesmium erythraeum 21-75]